MYHKLILKNTNKPCHLSNYILIVIPHTDLLSFNYTGVITERKRTSEALHEKMSEYERYPDSNVLT